MAIAAIGASVLAACGRFGFATGSDADDQVGPAAVDAAVVAADAPPARDAAPGAPDLPDAAPAIDAAPAVVELGRIAEWAGKVNVHKPAGGTWTHDDDCTSGAGQDQLTYCRKFWPETQSVLVVPVTPKPDPIWWTAGCTDVFVLDGLLEYVCES